MSEVQKILETHLKKSTNDYYGFINESYKSKSSAKAEQALYTLLMEKMPKKKEQPTSYSEDVEGDAYISGHIDGYNDYADEMVSAINELFGRTG